MARSKYVITDPDHWFAYRWVEKKLKNPAWLGEYRTYKAGRALQLIEESEIGNRTEKLNRWCETWLRSEEWTQLKNAVRASRRRAKQPEIKTITLSRNAWEILTYYADRDGSTLSEVIERKLGETRI